MRTTVQVYIKAPTVKVFEVFADIEHAAERISGIQKVEILSSVKNGLGTKWREARKMYGKEATEEMEITTYEPNKRYVVEAESHGSHYTTIFDFESLGGGSETKVTMTFIGQPLSFGAKLMSVFGPLMMSSVKKALASDMNDLKKFCESS